MDIDDIKTKRSLTVSREHSRNVDYWRDRSDDERWQGIEALRQMMYDYDPAAARVQRVLEVVQSARR